MDRKKIEKIVALLSILILGIGSLATLATIPYENPTQDERQIIDSKENEVGMHEQRLNSRLVIKILGNALFTDVNGVVSGEGTESNPYVIEGWYIDAQGSDACIYLENTTAYFIIRNCTLLNATNNNQWPGGAGIRLRNVRNGIIENNNITGNVGQGVHLKGCSNVKIINNLFLQNSGCNAEITNSNNCTILNNIFYEWGDGIKIWSEGDIPDFSDSVISNNYFYRTSCAISLRYRNRNIVSNNTFIENGDGIDLIDSSLNEVYNNTIVGYNVTYTAGQRGICLFGNSRYNNITLNKITDCDVGIHLWRVGSDWYGFGLGLNIFENNTITWTSNIQYYSYGIGVKIISGMNNLYIHNKISNMKKGFLLTTDAGECRSNIITENEVISNSESAVSAEWSTHDNRIYLNDFIRNGPNYLSQAYDNEPGQPQPTLEPNFWNTSTMGNYWLGWTSPDSDLDGIVDFPYLIGGDAAAKDYYPLAEPVSDDKPSALFEYPYDGLVVTIPNVQFNGKAFDDINVSKVQVRINGGEWYNCTLTYDVNKPGEVLWNYTLSLTPGTNTVDIISFDSGNQASDITSMSIIYDIQPPSVSITSHSNGQCVNSSMQIIEGISSDDIGISMILIRLNNGSWQEATGTTTWHHEVYLQYGNNFIEVQAVDFASRTTIISINVSYDLQPQIWIYSPLNGTITTQANITVNGYASDDFGIYVVQVRVINNQGASEWTNASGTNSWEIVVNLSFGNNVIQARAIDTSMQSSEIASVIVNCTNIEDDVIYLSIISPTQNENFPNSMIQVSGTLAYAQGLSNVVMKIRVNGGMWQSVNTNQAWSTFVTLQEGMNIIEVNASDEKNHVYANASVTVYYTPVVGAIYLTITSPMQNQVVYNSMIQVSGTLAYAQGLSNVVMKIRVNGGMWQSVNANQAWSTFVTLQVGMNIIEVNASDEINHVYANASVILTYINDNGQTLKQFNVMLTLEKDTIQSGGTVNLTLSVKDETNLPVANAYVVFSDWNHGGSFHANNLQTDAQGLVVCKYTAPNTNRELKVYINANITKEGFQNRSITEELNVKPIILDRDIERDIGFLLRLIPIIIILLVIGLIVFFVLKRKKNEVSRTQHMELQQPQQIQQSPHPSQIEPQQIAQPQPQKASAQSQVAQNTQEQFGTIPQHLKERTMSLKRALSACETIGIDVSESRKSYNELTDLLDTRKYEELLKRAEIDLQVALKKTVPQFIKSTEEDLAEYQKEGRDVTKARTASKALENKFAEGDYWGVIEKLVILDRAMNALAMESVEAKKEKGSVPISSSKSATATAVIRCAICFGHVKPGLAVRICSCGKKFHETCAVRVGECPSCHTKFESQKSDTKTENAETKTTN